MTCDRVCPQITSVQTVVSYMYNGIINQAKLSVWQATLTMETVGASALNCTPALLNFQAPARDHPMAAQNNPGHCGRRSDPCKAELLFDLLPPPPRQLRHPPTANQNQDRSRPVLQEQAWDCEAVWRKRISTTSVGGSNGNIMHGTIMPSPTSGWLM